ncbi:hypothetical protein HFN89_05780 [Rhizobium laguerreae]|nr:hypothetical protein [Rhizobium laguerreae]
MDSDCASTTDRFNDVVSAFDSYPIISARLKAGIGSPDRQTAHFALEVWNSYISSPIFIKADVTGFVVERLVVAEPISHWSNNGDLFYYLAVRGVIKAGRGEDMKVKLASRSD